MPAKATASPDDIELSSVFGALKKSFRRQLVISGLLFGLTYATLMMIAPKYQSEVELAIVARNASSNFTDSKSSNSSIDSITTKMDKEAINTHVRALRATELLEKVAEQMSLKDKPEFNAELGPIDQIDMLLRLVGIGGPRSGENQRRQPPVRRATRRIPETDSRNIEAAPAAEARLFVDCLSLIHI